MCGNGFGGNNCWWIIILILLFCNCGGSMWSGNNPGLVTDSPYFYIALTMMILGTQLFLTGFLGELISRNSQERNKYHVETSF